MIFVWIASSTVRKIAPALLSTIAFSFTMSYKIKNYQFVDLPALLSVVSPFLPHVNVDASWKKNRQSKGGRTIPYSALTRHTLYIGCRRIHQLVVRAEPKGARAQPRRLSQSRFRLPNSSERGLGLLPVIFSLTVFHSCSQPPQQAAECC